MKKITTKQFKASENLNERKVRVHTYIDIWVPRSGDDLADQEVARRKAEEYVMEIPNAFISDVDAW